MLSERNMGKQPGRGFSKRVEGLLSLETTIYHRERWESLEEDLTQPKLRFLFGPTHTDYMDVPPLHNAIDRSLDVEMVIVALGQGFRGGCRIVRRVLANAMSGGTLLISRGDGELNQQEIQAIVQEIDKPGVVGVWYGTGNRVPDAPIQPHIASLMRAQPTVLYPFVELPTGEVVYRSKTGLWQNAIVTGERMVARDKKTEFHLNLLPPIRSEDFNNVVNSVEIPGGEPERRRSEYIREMLELVRVIGTRELYQQVPELARQFPDFARIFFGAPEGNNAQLARKHQRRMKVVEMFKQTEYWQELIEAEVDLSWISDVTDQY